MSISRAAILGLTAATLAGCNPPHPHVRSETPLRAIAALDCPQEQGDLSLKSAASDGQSCVYADDGGAQVTLQLVKFQGADPSAVLAPIEARLKGELPPISPATSGADGNKDDVNIDLPGIHIHANDKDKDGQAQVNIGAPGAGAVNIDASNGAAKVVVDARGSGVRRVFMLTTDHPGPNGYKVVGYEAEGPAGGPLAVATVMAKDDDSLRDDMRALLRHNVGG